MSLGRGRRQENLRGLTSLNPPGGGLALPEVEMDQPSERIANRSEPLAANPSQSNIQTFAVGLHSRNK
jgi:hypothetical protein